MGVAAAALTMGSPYTSYTTPGRRWQQQAQGVSTLPCRVLQQIWIGSGGRGPPCHKHMCLVEHTAVKEASQQPQHLVKAVGKYG